MGSLNFLVKLFAMGYVLSMCLAVDCNWKTQYEYHGNCCESCPSGKYSKVVCSTQCEVCTPESSNTRCACEENSLCKDEACSKCVSRPRCKPGEELKRIGEYDFNYICASCPDKKYNDAEDSMCQLIADCKKNGLDMLFPGNKTHNAKCGWQDSDHHTYKVLMLCLVINGLICLALVFNACIQRLMYRKNNNRRSVGFPHEECSCKLSKEEKGDV